MKGNITKTGRPGSHRLCGSKTLKKRERERERDRGFSKTSTSIPAVTGRESTTDNPAHLQPDLHVTERLAGGFKPTICML